MIDNESSVRLQEQDVEKQYFEALDLENVLTPELEADDSVATNEQISEESNPTQHTEVQYFSNFFTQPDAVGLHATSCGAVCCFPGLLFTVLGGSFFIWSDAYVLNSLVIGVGALVLIASLIAMKNGMDRLNEENLVTDPEEQDLESQFASPN